MDCRIKLLKLGSDHLQTVSRVSGSKDRLQILTISVQNRPRPTHVRRTIFDPDQSISFERIFTFEISRNEFGAC
eukprot:2395135-Pyramimonas_sp.AAC.1